MTHAPWTFPAPDELSARAAEARHDRLTKPLGSLGRLEGLVRDLAAWQGSDRPSVRPAAAILFAADHPVTRHGVSAYPSAVTLAMLSNFANGGAAASVLSRRAGISLTVVDVGVDPAGAVQNPAANPGAKAPVRVVRDPVAGDPAGDIRVEDAMSEHTYLRCLDAGVRAVDSLPPDVRCVILGEMGIGNTTVASAVAAALLGCPPGDLVGAGTGVTGGALVAKREVVREAVARLDGARDGATVLRRVGGRDIVALVGAMARAVERRRVVLVDGFIVTAAALALTKLDPRSRPGLFFSHRSAEQAHGHLLEALGARPLVELDLRLGEGSGALIAWPLLDAACGLHGEMASFDEARVPDVGG